MLLAIILLAVAALCISLWVGEGPLWRWVMTEVVVSLEDSSDLPEEFTEVREWRRQNRWNHTPIHVQSYYVSTGYQASDVRWKNGEPYRGTWWFSDGRVVRQNRWGDQVEKITLMVTRKRGRTTVAVPAESRGKAPWWWGVTNQTEPSAPRIRKR